MCTSMFIAALFTITKIKKQSQTTDEWIQKLYTNTNMHAGILLSHDKNKVLPFATTRMDLECVYIYIYLINGSVYYRVIY